MRYQNTFEQFDTEQIELVYIKVILLHALLFEV